MKLFGTLNSGNPGSCRFVFNLSILYRWGENIKNNDKATTIYVDILVPSFCIVGVQPQCKLGVFSYGSYHSDIKREEPK